MKRIGWFAAVAALVAGCVSTQIERDDVVIENSRFKLVIGADATAKSLVVKATGEEMLDVHECLPAFFAVQDRPFNNEIKLIYPHKRTTYPANSLHREEGRLIVGFEIAPYEAVVELKESDAYVEFRLADFLVDKEDYDYLKMDVPPVASWDVSNFSLCFLNLILFNSVWTGFSRW